MEGERGKPIVKSRIDNFLISHAMYDHLKNAEILEEEIPSTDHKMIRVKLNLFQFIKGTGYYRCQNTLLQDLNFSKLLKIQIEQRLRRDKDIRQERQLGNPKEKATEVLMEIIKMVTLMAMNYA